MTFRERLREEHPEAIVPEALGGCAGCPSDSMYGYEKPLTHCPTDSCRKCWDREIPEECFGGMA